MHRGGHVKYINLTVHVQEMRAHFLALPTDAVEFLLSHPDLQVRHPVLQIRQLQVRHPDIQVRHPDLQIRQL